MTNPIADSFIKECKEELKNKSLEIAREWKEKTTNESIWGRWAEKRLIAGENPDVVISEMQNGFKQYPNAGCVKILDEGGCWCDTCGMLEMCL